MEPNYAAAVVSNLIFGLTMIGTFATAFVIWWQVSLLRTQNQVQSLLKLNELWDSRRMLQLRSDWAKASEEVDTSEPVLEFLEEFAGLKRRGVLDEDLIWESVLGWYAAHYYAYNRLNNNIDKIRNKWSDETLYRNLDELYLGYLNVESRSRSISTPSLEKQIEGRRDDFLKDEQYRYARYVSKSSD
jgi:hypothetical protein